ncbi:MAG: class II fructose-bisphosphate aldolase [Herpetosiphonaceae bacterium]|nr:class II fructose-bisphosphate aldolase [Herpetosiphonaceae bacterium]
MLVSTRQLLQAAQQGNYALGAFNVYNLEGVRAVVLAAETERSPALLQLHPSAFAYGGPPLVALCLAAAKHASVPISVHLDHSASPDAIQASMAAGLTSIMADGSHLAYHDNVTFTRQMAKLVHASGGFIEAELGLLSGTEDGLTVPEYEAKLTDPQQAASFAAETGIDALAVCIGNVHGHYHGAPQLDFDRLALLQRAIPVPLVLHGASGLPAPLVRRAIALGVRKLNVNTELREAYLGALKSSLGSSQSPDLLALLQTAVAAMQAVVAEKLQLFGSAGRI